MPKFETIERKIKHVLTWLWVRLVLRAEWIGAKQLELLDQPVKVYEFNKEGVVPAQTTAFNTIVWNDAIMETQSEEVKRLALYHERSHQDRNPVYKGILWGSVILAATGAAFSLLSLGYSLVFGISLSNFGPVLGQSGIFIGVFALLFRIEETKADYDALCEMGEERFKEAYRAFAYDDGPSILSSLFGQILYTDPKHVIQIRGAIQSL